MSCTAADLINIQPLTLSDTFHTWFDRTNEAIESLNAVNILTVDVGVSSGLEIISGCQSGYYNGNIVIDTNVGGGVGIGSANYTGRTNEIVIDFVDLSPFNDGVSGNPDIGDQYIVSDVSDTAQGPAGTPKKIAARYMLPNKVTMGQTGGGTLQIEGNLVINNNLTVLGTQSFIQVEDLRVEDKIIELASSPYTAFMLQGSSSAVAGITAGMTGHFYSAGDPLPFEPGEEEVRFKVRSIQRQPSGTTAYIEVHRISSGSTDLLDIGGTVLINPPLASGLTFDVITDPVGGAGLFEDAVLSPAGVRVKGEDGDKDFLWTNTHNRFATNTNLGLDKSYSFLVGSKFGSYGYSDTPTTSRDNTFSFVGTSGQDTTLEIANGSMTVTGDNWKNSSWKLTKKATPGALQNYQRLEFVHDSGATAYPIATFYAGRTGPTYTGVGVSGWAQHLNVDMLDGAHAYQTATAYSIPVAGADGRIDAAWVSSEWIGKKYTIAGGHTFGVGDVVRIDSGNGGLTYAVADTSSMAEAIGMISVVDGNTVTVVTKGFIPSLPNSGKFTSVYPAVTGNVYFLSSTTPGGLIGDPNTFLQPGEIRKPMFLATGISSGYVLDFVGSVFGGDVTDQVYMPTVNPVGSVQPFAGPTAGVPQGWLLCDGRAYGRLAYSDLFDAIGNNHFANAKTTATANIIEFADNIRGLTVGNPLKIEWTLAEGGITSADTTISAVDAGTKRVTLSGVTLPTANYPVRVYGRVAGSDANMVFFVPDLRGRSAFGVSTLNVPIDPTVAIGLGVQGGNTTTTVPDHKHFSRDGVISTGAGAINSDTGMLYTGGVTGTGTTPIMPPYVGLHWIIRAVKILPAMIITGHHHDSRYIRYDAPHTTPTLSNANLAQFHTNAAVLSDGTIGADTFSNILTIDNTPGGATSGPWSSYWNNIQSIGAFNQHNMFRYAGLNVLAADFNRAGINIFNDNSGNLQDSDGGHISFWGVGVSGVTAWPRMIGGVYADLNNLPDTGTPSTTASPHQKTIGLFMGGITDGYNVMLVQKVWNPNASGTSNRTFRYLFPYSLTSAPVHTSQMKNVMLRTVAGSSPELVEYTGTALSGSDLYTTGGITFAGAASMSTAVAGSDTAFLTVDKDSGTVAMKKMIEVTGSAPPDDTEAAAYPEGFVWYKTTEGGSQGSAIPGTVPVGSIVIWSGTIDEALALASAGWALCDGRLVTVNGVQRTTPDLRGRFIVGANSGTGTPSSGGVYAVNAVGGTGQVALTTQQMPAHSHKVFATAGGENQTPVSSHPQRPAYFEGNGVGNNVNFEYSVTTSTIPPSSASFGSPSQETGSGQAHENRPPYYALAYIMRIS